MDLYILRHAIAESRPKDPRGHDSGRRLTCEGERKTGKGAARMKEAGLSFDLILSSPYTRAKQTADIVAKALKLRKVLRLSGSLAPDMDAGKVIEELNTAWRGRKSVLLVGHEPHLSELISLLISGERNVVINFKKGALCKLTVETLQPGRCATLDWLLTPRQLRSLR